MNKVFQSSGLVVQSKEEKTKKKFIIAFQCVQLFCKEGEKHSSCPLGAKQKVVGLNYNKGDLGETLWKKSPFHCKGS